MPEEYLLQAIEDIKSLKPNWDSDGAEVPSEKSIQIALDVLQWARQNNVKVFSVDADVLGGIAVYLSGKYLIWVSVLNNGTSCITYNEKSLDFTFDNLNILHSN